MLCLSVSLNIPMKTWTWWLDFEPGFQGKNQSSTVITGFNATKLKGFNATKKGENPKRVSDRKQIGDQSPRTRHVEVSGKQGFLPWTLYCTL